MGLFSASTEFTCCLTSSLGLTSCQTLSKIVATTIRTARQSEKESTWKGLSNGSAEGQEKAWSHCTSGFWLKNKVRYSPATQRLELLFSFLCPFNAVFLNSSQCCLVVVGRYQHDPIWAFKFPFVAVILSRAPNNYVQTWAESTHNFAACCFYLMFKCVLWTVLPRTQQSSQGRALVLLWMWQDTPI